MSNLGENDKEESEDAFQQILARLSLIPTTDGLTDLTVYMAKEMKSYLTDTSSKIHQRLTDTIEAANNLPGNLGKELTKRMKEMFKTVFDSIRDRDKLYLTEISKHKEVVALL